MTDIQHFTEEEIEGHLQTAQAMVERLALPADIEGQTILWVAGKLAEKTIIPTQALALGGGALVQ